MGEKNNYKEAIDNIVNDILANSRTITSWKNSSGLIDFLKTKFSDKAYLNKTIDFIISNAKERLENFRINIFNLIEKYVKIIINKINIEKINIQNILEEKKEKKKIENIKLKEQNEKEKEKYEKMKKEAEEKNKKWNEICEEYNKVKDLINQIVKEPEILESQETVEGEEETVTPQ
jgi:hypothetical protein